jgi:RsiW-degrading membrane proteinase PrsW (M82 family)
VRLPGKFVEVARAHPRRQGLASESIGRGFFFRLIFNRGRKQIVARHEEEDSSGDCSCPKKSSGIRAVDVKNFRGQYGGMSEFSNVNSLLLVCVAGPDAGKRIAVTAKTVSLGRLAACELASDDADVSERHLTLELKSGKIFFATKAGGAAFVDGQRVEQGTIEARQQLRVGRSLWQLEAPAGSGDISSFLENIGDKISEVAGVEKIEGFSPAAMFSEIWRKRTDEEMEGYFAVGTPTTTPPLAEVDASWPRPWLFVKIFGLAALVYFGLVFAYQTFNNDLMLPGMLTIGSFVMPFSLLIFFFEVNVPRNVPLYQILKMLFLGGILSLITALALFQFTKWGGTDSWLSAVGVGLIEEAGKAAALLIIVNKLKYRWTLNGLLFGAAVGAGFAAFESAGYAYLTGGDLGRDAMLHNITLRGLLSICGGHVLWAALAGAALWRVRGEKKFEWSMLQDVRFLRVFGLCAVMHAVWDAPLNLPMDLKYIALGFVVWVALLSFIQSGLRQIRAAQADATK